LSGQRSSAGKSITGIFISNTETGKLALGPEAGSGITVELWLTAMTQICNNYFL
jgi:hypothetical protein